MKMKLLTICLITAVIAGSAYATKNDANLATLNKAFEVLVDASGKNVKMKFTDKEYTFIYYASKSSEECQGNRMKTHSIMELCFQDF